MRATEAGLALDASHEAFAAAMGECLSASASCCFTGECAYGGECFRSEDAARRKAIRLLDDLASDVAADIAAYIRVARAALASEPKP